MQYSSIDDEVEYCIRKTDIIDWYGKSAVSWSLVIFIHYTLAKWCNNTQNVISGASRSSLVSAWFVSYRGGGESITDWIFWTERPPRFYLFISPYWKGAYLKTVLCRMTCSQIFNDSLFNNIFLRKNISTSI